MTDRPEPMDDEDFKHAVSTALRDAVDFIESEVAPDRAKALDYHLGKPFGDERDGRSQVIATEVRDTISAILPSLMRIFHSAEKSVEFVPRGPEDVAVAQQATDYANLVFSTDNDGFALTETALLDGMLSKTGIVRWRWDDSVEVTGMRLSGITADELTVIAQDPRVEIVSAAQEEAEDGEVGTFDVELRRSAERHRIVLENIPPEEFVINRHARSLADAQILGHRKTVTLSDLVAMGYAWDDVQDLTGDEVLDRAQEKQARQPWDVSPNKDEPADPTQRRVSYADLLVRVDKDGDGVAELRRVCVAGKGDKVLHEEPWDEVNYAAWCPYRLPHTFFGLSVADKTMDLQRIKSVIWRQTLDNLVLANNPRVGFVEGQAQLEDLLNDEMGAVIRMRSPGAVVPFAVPFVAGQSLPILDMLDQVKEARTGMSKASMGLDADSLQSTTKAAVSATISAAQGQVEMLARVFAEQLMRPMFRGILRLAIKHQDKPRMVRLRNEFVPVDPRSWNADMDVTVNVGLGRGSDDERLQALGMIAMKQEQAIMQGGPNNPLCSVAHYRNTLADMAAIAGFKDAGRYFLDPASQPPQQPAPPPPDPKMIEAQARVQIETQKASADAQMAAMKMQHDQQLAEARLQQELTLQRERVGQEIALKREQFAAELELRKAQMMAEAQLARDTAALDHHAKTQAIGNKVEMGGDVG